MVESGNRVSRHSEIITVIILGMVVKGLDLTPDDVVSLGYPRSAVYRGFDSLVRAGVIRKVGRSRYILVDRIWEMVRRLASKDHSGPFGWPSIENFLLNTYGRFGWEEFVKQMVGGHDSKGTDFKRGLAEPANKTYGMKEASALLGVSMSTIRNWEREGMIRCVRLPSGRRRIPQGEILRILEKVSSTNSS